MQNKNSPHSKQTLTCWIGWIYENSYFSFPDRLWLKVPLKILNSSTIQLCEGLPIAGSYCSTCHRCIPALSLLGCICSGTKECFSRKDYLACTLQQSLPLTALKCLSELLPCVFTAVLWSDPICSWCNPTYHHCHQPAAHCVKTWSITFRLTFKLFSFKLFLRVAWRLIYFLQLRWLTSKLTG